MNRIIDLVTEVKIILKALHVPYKVINLGRDLPEACLVSIFGTVVMGIDGKDYSYAISKLNAEYKGFRIFFITPVDNLIEKKDELIFDLMRSGYMRYIRITYPRQFNGLIKDYGYGRKIVNERLRIWGDLPRFQFLVEENKLALEDQSEVYIMSVDPSFYDYMPEKIGD